MKHTTLRMILFATLLLSGPLSFATGPQRSAEDNISFTANLCCYKLYNAFNTYGDLPDLFNKEINRIMDPDKKCYYYANEKKTLNGHAYLNIELCTNGKACSNVFNKSRWNVFNGLLWSFKFGKHQYSMGEGCEHQNQ